MPFTYATRRRRLLLIFVLALRIIIILHILFRRIFAPLRICRFIRYYEVIIMLTGLRILFLRSDDGAAVLFISLARLQALSIYDQFVTNHLRHAFHYCDLQNRRYPFLLFGNEYAIDGLVDVHRI